MFTVFKMLKNYISKTFQDKVNVFNDISQQRYFLLKRFSNFSGALNHTSGHTYMYSRTNILNPA